MSAKNKYCNISDFRKEDSVEKHFIDNLLKDLGYKEKILKKKKILKLKNLI